MTLAWIDSRLAGDPFPDVRRALAVPDGLLAVGGTLEPELLLTAYRRGIFPWYSAGQPLLWWSPDPRAVFFPDRLHVSRSLAKRLRRRDYTVTLNCDFAAVIGACSLPRQGQDGTWITPEMTDAYRALAALGHAHSVEVWSAGELVGGLYGVAIGRVFYGESMFSLQRDASKVASATLATNLDRRGYRLIDCQVQSAHLDSLGAQTLPRTQFIALLQRLCDEQPEAPLTRAPEQLDHAF